MTKPMPTDQQLRACYRASLLHGSVISPRRLCNEPAGKNRPAAKAPPVHFSSRICWQFVLTSFIGALLAWAFIYMIGWLFIQAAFTL